MNQNLTLIEPRFSIVFPCGLFLLDLVGAKSVYIITDLMKASRITACVTSDDDNMEVVSLTSVPIGFGYSKFRLTPEGLVAEQVTPLLSFTSAFAAQFIFTFLTPSLVAYLEATK